MIDLITDRQRRFDRWRWWIRKWLERPERALLIGDGTAAQTGNPFAEYDVVSPYRSTDSTKTRTAFRWIIIV